MGDWAVGEGGSGPTAARRTRGLAVIRALRLAPAPLILAGLLAGCSPGQATEAQGKAGQTPSGLPVPRYVVLKFDPVNARSGPSDDHRLLWTYHVRGLPVQVVGETKDWRRICDPDGGLSWVHKRTTDGRRSVMRTQAGPAAIRSGPKDKAGVIAYLAPRALASLDHCQAGWCRIKVGASQGWIAAADVWGVTETPQCR